MEFKHVFAGLAILVVGLIALFSFSSDYETELGFSISQDINSTQATIDSVINNLSYSSSEVGTAGVPEEGASTGTGDDNLIRRGLRIMGAIPRLAGLPLSLMDDVGTLYNIDERIVNVAKYTFTFVFFLTLAYVFILGVRRLL